MSLSVFAVFEFGITRICRIRLRKRIFVAVERETAARRSLGRVYKKYETVFGKFGGHSVFENVIVVTAYNFGIASTYRSVFNVPFIGVFILRVGERTRDKRT